MFWRFTVIFEDEVNGHEEKTESGILHTEDDKWGSAAKELEQYYGNSLILINLKQFAPDNVLIGFSEEVLDRTEEEVVW